MPLRRKMSLFALPAIACFCLPGALNSAEFANLPDFSDFRRAGEIVQAYSRNRENNNYGVTLRMRENTIRAMADGRVHSAGQLRGYGKVVIVDHGQGWHTLYSNLARVQVHRGQQVSQGDVLGQPRHKRLFLVVSYRGNPINPSDVIGRRPRGGENHSARTQRNVHFSPAFETAASAG